jgi:DNA-binding response OmpR family regulator
LGDAMKEAHALGGGAISRPPPPPSAAPGRKHVLLVDDDARVRTELANALKPYYDVHEAADGLVAAELCNSISPSLIVCDVVMPRLDGFSFAKLVKSNPRLSKVPLVFLTSRTGSTDVMQGLSLGARAYIPKPFSTPDVVMKIRKMLG